MVLLTLTSFIGKKKPIKLSFYKNQIPVTVWYSFMLSFSMEQERLKYKFKEYPEEAHEFSPLSTASYFFAKFHNHPLISLYICLRVFKTVFG